MGTGGFLRKWVFLYISSCGQHATRVCKPCLLSALSRGAAGSGGTICAAAVSSSTETSGLLTNAQRNETPVAKSLTLKCFFGDQNAPFHWLYFARCFPLHS